jgi:hypothetical protein
MDFNGCSDSIQGAKDYKEFRLLAYGSYEDDLEDSNDNTEEEDTESEEEDDN